MYTVDFSLQNITPVFMYGADNTTPEIRPASIKGIMRWWYRALVSENDIKKLYEAESDLFGNTQKTSKVKVRIINPFPKDDSAFREFNNEGVGYLYYSMKMKMRDGISIGLPGHQFIVKLFSDDLQKLELAASTFWLAIYFGGFGSRARRTAGNMNVVNINKNNSLNIPEFVIPENLNNSDFLTWLERQWKFIKQSVTPGSTNKYSTLHNARFYLLSKTSNSWQDAVNLIGNYYKNFRVTTPRFQPDYDIVKNHLARQIHLIKHMPPEYSNTIERAAFGLPIQFRFSSLQKKNHFPYEATIVGDKETDRRASPLIFKVFKLSDNCFTTGVLHLGGEFLPQNHSKIQIKAQKTEPTFLSHPSNTIITNFISTLPIIGEFAL